MREKTKGVIAPFSFVPILTGVLFNHHNDAHVKTKQKHHIKKKKRCVVVCGCGGVGTLV